MITVYGIRREDRYTETDFLQVAFVMDFDFSKIPNLFLQRLVGVTVRLLICLKVLL